MTRSKTLRLTVAALLCAVAVTGSLFSFPMLGSKCSPVQHMVNVICAVLLGPWYGVGAAFLAALLRNLMGLGSLLAFPGSMCGALLSGLMYRKSRRVTLALAGETMGTGFLGGALAWPVAVLFMGVPAENIAFYGYMVPFLISTAVGSLMAGALVWTLQRNGALKRMQERIG